MNTNIWILLEFVLHIVMGGPLTHICDNRTGRDKSTPINSLWLSDVIWQQRFRSTLAQVIACCLMAPSHYFNQFDLWRFVAFTLQWGHNGPNGVSNDQPHHCLLSRFFRCRSKKASKLRVTGLCAGNSPMTGEFPAQWPVTRKMFLFYDIIMTWEQLHNVLHRTCMKHLFSLDHWEQK